MVDFKKAITESLAEETGIDTESATKVINWLVSEGVLDMPVVAENFEGVRE